MRNERQIRSGLTKFETREENGEKLIEGYFAVFDSNYELWDGATESIGRNAFDGTLGDDIRALINHETRLVLGRTTAGTLTLRVDENGLWGGIKINEADSDAMNLYARVQRGDVSQCSFGFDILQERTDVDSATGAVHWTIEKVKLYEVSCVTFPAYKETAIQARAEEYRDIKKRENERWKEAQKERLTKWH